MMQLQCVCSCCCPKQLPTALHCSTRCLHAEFLDNSCSAGTAEAHAIRMVEDALWTLNHIASSTGDDDMRDEVVKAGVVSLLKHYLTRPSPVTSEVGT